jgi:hypothetical protein
MLDALIWNPRKLRSQLYRSHEIEGFCPDEDLPIPARISRRSSVSVRVQIFPSMILFTHYFDAMTPGKSRLVKIAKGT